MYVTYIDNYRYRYQNTNTCIVLFPLHISICVAAIYEFVATFLCFYSTKQIKANKSNRKQKQKENKYEYHKENEQTETDTEKHNENEKLCQIVVRKTLTHLNYRSNQHLVFQSVAFSGKSLLTAPPRHLACSPSSPSFLPHSLLLSLSLVCSFKLLSLCLSLCLVCVPCFVC